MIDIIQKKIQSELFWHPLADRHQPFRQVGTRRGSERPSRCSRDWKKNGATQSNLVQCRRACACTCVRVHRVRMHVRVRVRVRVYVRTIARAPMYAMVLHLRRPAIWVTAWALVGLGPGV